MTPSKTERLASAKAYLQRRGLSSDWSAVRERARNPHSQVLARWAASRVAPAPTRAAPARRRVSNARQFNAGASGPYTFGWNVSDAHVNSSLHQNLRALRARANALARNSEYGNAFLRIVQTNVVGPFGFQLQVPVMNQKGEPDTDTGQLVENAFAAWGRPGVCDFAGELSWRDMCDLWINTVARDGEVLVRRIRGAGPFGYQLQLIDPALLDEQHIQNLPNGNRIRMGVELDPQGRRVGYWLTGTDRADPRLGGFVSSGKRIRIDASEIWHDFRPQWIDQLRGVPWMAAGMIRQHRLEEFELAALAAAEEGAKKLAWISLPDGSMAQMADGVLGNRQSDVTSGGEPVTAEAASTDPESGTLYTDSGEGIHYARLPNGATVTPYSANYPDEAVGQFVRTALQGLSAAWGVPHHSLSGDMTGVTYSSARIAEMEARDLWKKLQEWMIERFCARVYSEWLPYALLSRRLPLPMDRLARYDVALWQGRRWEWVDPSNELAAVEKKLDLGLSSKRREQRNLGHDPDEIRKEIEIDKKLDAASGASSSPPSGEPV